MICCRNTYIKDVKTDVDRCQAKRRRGGDHILKAQRDESTTPLEQARSLSIQHYLYSGQETIMLFIRFPVILTLLFGHLIASTFGLSRSVAFPLTERYNAATDQALADAFKDMVSCNGSYFRIINHRIIHLFSVSSN